MRIKEIIVVEGRDDTTAVTRSIDCHTIETHGFGIKNETWKLIEKAYNDQGIIIFTDPDNAGEAIRKKLTERFPDAKQAYLSRNDALDGTGKDIGIENANDEAIYEALMKAKAHLVESTSEFTAKDIQMAGLTGLDESKEMRQKLGKILGIGYANGKTLVKKLNSFGITRAQFDDAINQIRKEIYK